MKRTEITSHRTRYQQSNKPVMVEIRLADDLGVFADISSSVDTTSVHLFDADELATELRRQRAQWLRCDRPVRCKAFNIDVSDAWHAGPVTLVRAVCNARQQHLLMALADAKIGRAAA